MQALAAFGGGGGGQRNMVEFRCGKMKMDGNGTTVRPDPRKGKLAVNKSEDGLMHLTWTDRAGGVVEDDFIIFPGDATFSYVEKARSNTKNNRVYVLKFTSTNKLHFFWLQEPNQDNDADLTSKVNAFINGEEPANGTGGGAASVGQMDQAQLLAMLTQGRSQPMENAAATATTADSAATAEGGGGGAEGGEAAADSSEPGGAGAGEEAAGGGEAPEGGAEAGAGEAKKEEDKMEVEGESKGGEGEGGK